MNYGKNGISKKEKELTSKGTMIRKKFGVLLLKLTLIVDRKSTRLNSSHL